MRMVIREDVDVFTVDAAAGLRDNEHNAKKGERDRAVKLDGVPPSTRKFHRAAEVEASNNCFPVIGSHTSF